MAFCYWTIISPIYNSSLLSAINRFVYVSMSEIRNQQLQEDLEKVIDRMTQLEADLSVLKMSALELKLSTAVSERSAKEETIATLNEVSKKGVCELEAELETAAKSNSEFQKELHHVKCEQFRLRDAKGRYCTPKKKD